MAGTDTYRRTLGTATALALTLLCGGAAEPSACVLPEGDLSVSDLPAGSSVIACDAVGRTVVGDNGISAQIPEPGMSVGAFVTPGEDADASPDWSFSVAVSDEGIVSYP